MCLTVRVLGCGSHICTRLTLLKWSRHLCRDRYSSHICTRLTSVRCKEQDIGLSCCYTFSCKKGRIPCVCEPMVIATRKLIAAHGRTLSSLPHMIPTHKACLYGFVKHGFRLASPLLRSAEGYATTLLRRGSSLSHSPSNSVSHYVVYVYTYNTKSINRSAKTIKNFLNIDLGSRTSLR